MPSKIQISQTANFCARRFASEMLRTRYPEYKANIDLSPKLGSHDGERKEWSAISPILIHLAAAQILESWVQIPIKKLCAFFQAIADWYRMAFLPAKTVPKHHPIRQQSFRLSIRTSRIVALG
jgi:hypothetical protein